MNNEYLNTVLNTERISELIKRVAAWIILGLLLHWIFDFSQIAAILAILATDLLVLSPIAFFREKNAYSAETFEEMQDTIAQLQEIGGQNYDLAMSRKVSLELAEEKLSEISAKFERITDENQRNEAKIGEILTQYREVFDRYNSLELKYKSLQSEFGSLKSAESSLAAQNSSLAEKLQSLIANESSLTEKIESLTDENKSLKFAKDSLTAQIGSLQFAESSLSENLQLLQSEFDSLKLENISLNEQVESLKQKYKEEVNRANALRGVIKRQNIES